MKKHDFPSNITSIENHIITLSPASTTNCPRTQTLVGANHHTLSTSQRAPASSALKARKNTPLELKTGRLGRNPVKSRIRLPSVRPGEFP